MTEQLYGGTAAPDPDSRSSSLLTPEQRAALLLVLVLLFFLGLLVVRCFRILLDPYRSMPASNWTDCTDKGAFDYGVVS
ncbi:cortexin-3-like [Syngnathoides biaculeatus]|uniref:cortexin-3-like n=1 Tax=Syngnathoides biaculeatus TaxID=300417 RepID=UPI002ADD8E71|nr:cortexin-3-like [Syngnathoides biaculeatus]